MKSIITMSAKLIFLASAFILTQCETNKKIPDEIIETNIIVTVKYKAQPNKGNYSIEELTKLIEKVKQEPHFINIKLHVDPKDNTNILLYEEWNNESYYNSEHMKTNHLQEFIANSRNFLSGPPEINVWKVKSEFKP